MNFFYRTGTMILLLLCQFCCINSKVKQKNYFGKITAVDIPLLSTYKINKTDNYFGIQYAVVDDRQYFVTFYKKELTFYNFFDTSYSFKINFSQKFLGFSDFLIGKINGTFFYVLDGDKNIVVTYGIDYLKKEATYKSIYPIPIALNPDIPNGKYIGFDSKTIFDVKDSILHLAYGNNSDFGNNFLGENRYLKFTMTDDKQVLTIPTFPVPERFRKGKCYYPLFYLKPINDSLFVFGYSAFDSVYLYNFNTSVLTKRAEFSKNSNYGSFDMTKATNLAYVKKFELTDERNIVFAVNYKTQKIFIIKRLKKEKITDNDICEGYMIDENLNTIAFVKIKEKILSDYVMPFKNGFLVLDSSRKKVIVYE